MEDNGILLIMTWPSLSTDLSQIDLVWDEIDCKVKSDMPKTFTHFLEIISINVFLQVTRKDAKNLISCSSL